MNNNNNNNKKMKRIDDPGEKVVNDNSDIHTSSSSFTLSVFNFKKFFLSNKTWGNEEKEETPPLLCFPTFFYCSITTLLGELSDAYYKTKFESALPVWLTYYICLERNVEHYISILKNVFKLIVNDERYICNFKDSKIIMDKFMIMIKTQKLDERCLFLEYYLNETDDSIRNYQTALKDVNLNYNNVDSIPALLNHLKQEGVIVATSDTITKAYYQDESKDLENSYYTLLSSSFYVLTSRIPYATNVWGPIYWNVFHALPKNAKEKEEEERLRRISKSITTNTNNNNTILNVLHSFILSMSFLVPCSICRYHYMLNVRPSYITPLTSIAAYENIYSEIHNIVKKNTLITNKM